MLKQIEGSRAVAEAVAMCRPEVICAYPITQVLDPAEPVSIGAMVGPEAFTEVRYLAHERMQQALQGSRPSSAPSSAGTPAAWSGRTGSTTQRSFWSRSVRCSARPRTWSTNCAPAA
jgi:hypothetical protein